MKTIFVKSNYPFNFIDSCFKSFLDKFYLDEVMVLNVLKRNVFVKLLFLRSTSKIRKNLQTLLSDKLTSCNLKIVFTSPVRVQSFFIFKAKLAKMLLLGIVYKHKCGGCNATYYGRPSAILKSEFVNI